MAARKCEVARGQRLVVFGARVAAALAEAREDVRRFVGALLRRTRGRSQSRVGAAEPGGDEAYGEVCSVFDRTRDPGVQPGRDRP